MKQKPGGSRREPEACLTVRALHNELSGDGEHWVLTAGGPRGAVAKRPPVFEYGGNLVVGLTPKFVARLGGMSPEGPYYPEDAVLVANEDGSFDELVMRLAADEHAMIMIWDPLLGAVVPAIACRAGRTVRFIIPKEVLNRLRVLSSQTDIL